MCAKVLILSGSPRKNGNTEILCERFAAGARDAGNEVEVLRVCGLDIHYCTGCDSCVKTGRCVHRDDMEAVREKMTAADVLVFSSPVYFYTISAQMKTLIDLEVTPKFNLLAEELQNVNGRLDRLTTPEEFEIMDSRMDTLELVVKKHSREIAELKKAQ